MNPSKEVFVNVEEPDGAISILSKPLIITGLLEWRSSPSVIDYSDIKLSIIGTCLVRFKRKSFN